jgi:hypothetical protein
VKVLLVSEGKHEGHADEEKPQALRALVARVLPAETTFEWLDVHDLPRGNTITGKGKGHLKLALKAMKHAIDCGFDALILVTDADRQQDRIAQFDAAQQSIRFPIPRALGIPVEAFDAWILADHQAMSNVLKAEVSLLPLPENYAGPKGSPRHPKQVCRALMRQHAWDGSPAEFYEAVCACADLDVIADRCPRGFQPFLARVRDLLAR